jgi:hypothetical protein
MLFRPVRIGGLILGIDRYRYIGGLVLDRDYDFYSAYLISPSSIWIWIWICSYPKPISYKSGELQTTQS